MSTSTYEIDGSQAEPSVQWKIYVEHGTFDLKVRGCDEDGSYYLNCWQGLQPCYQKLVGQPVIRVSSALEQKRRAATAKGESSHSLVDETADYQKDWVEIKKDAEVEDEWIQVGEMQLSREQSLVDSSRLQDFQSHMLYPRPLSDRPESCLRCAHAKVPPPHRCFKKRNHCLLR